MLTRCGALLPMNGVAPYFLLARVAPRRDCATRASAQVQESRFQLAVVAVVKLIVLYLIHRH